MLIFTDQYVTVHLDGNSNIASSQTTNNADKLGIRLLAADPLNGNVSARNWAKGGATWKTMLDGSDASGIQEIHAAFEPGKQNILIVGEDFNAAIAEGSLSVVLAQRRAYFAAVLAAHPWRILGMTMPAGKDEEGLGFNTIIDGCNDDMRANWASMGLEGYIETRPPGGPFDYAPPYGYSLSKFENTPNYLDGAHWSPTGIGVILEYITAKLETLPDVAPTSSETAPSVTGTTGSILLGWP